MNRLTPHGDVQRVPAAPTKHLADRMISDGMLRRRVDGLSSMVAPSTVACGAGPDQEDLEIPLLRRRRVAQTVGDSDGRRQLGAGREPAHSPLARLAIVEQQWLTVEQPAVQVYRRASAVGHVGHHIECVRRRAKLSCPTTELTVPRVRVP